MKDKPLSMLERGMKIALDPYMFARCR